VTFRSAVRILWQYADSVLGTKRHHTSAEEQLATSGCSTRPSLVVYLWLYMWCTLGPLKAWSMMDA
jgi:hypothetical protein